MSTVPGFSRRIGQTTYQNSDEELKEPDWPAPHRIPERQKQEHVGRGQENPGP